MNHARETVIVNQLDLAPGMIVLEWGGHLRVTHLNHEWTQARGWLVRNFSTELVAIDLDSYVTHDAQLRGWMERGEYHLQGNQLVSHVVLADSVQAGA